MVNEDPKFKKAGRKFDKAMADSPVRKNKDGNPATLEEALEIDPKLSKRFTKLQKYMERYQIIQYTEDNNISWDEFLKIMREGQEEPSEIRAILVQKTEFSDPTSIQSKLEYNMKLKILQGIMNEHPKFMKSMNNFAKSLDDAGVHINKDGIKDPASIVALIESNPEVSKRYAKQEKYLKRYKIFESLDANNIGLDEMLKVMQANKEEPSVK